MNTKALRIKEKGNKRLIEIEGSSGTNEEKARAKVKVIFETAQQLHNIK